MLKFYARDANESPLSLIMNNLVVWLLGDV